MMIIEWYTTVFQMINFLILVFLLRRFLYGPITRTMEEREAKIARREDAAAALKEEAVDELRSYRQRADELDRQAEEIVRRARVSSEEEKRTLLDEARRDVEATRRRWEEALERERETFTDELRRRIGKQACSIARRCLTELADARLEELTWEVFLRKIDGLPATERSELGEAIASAGDRLTLRSAFEAPAERVRELAVKLGEILSGPGAGLRISATTDPALVCGIEIESGGYRVAWSVEGYLDDVEEKILGDIGRTPAGGPSGEASGDD